MMQEEKSVTEMITFNGSETCRIMKNVVVISLAFMMQFTAYNGAANLQSSINAEAGLGTAALAAVYAGLIIFSLFLPVVVIKWLGTKWVISLAFLTYMPYIAAQFYPTFYTLIPAGFLVGVGAGPLWCAKCTYLSEVSKVHSKISKISAEALLTRFLGIFYMISSMNQVWGNLISSLVLTSRNNTAAVTSVDASQVPELCGANFLPSADAAEALKQQPPEMIHTLAGIYLACMAAASLIVALGVDSMKRYESGRKAEGGQSGLALLAVTLKLMLEPNLQLLIMINIFAGYQQAFFGADMTAAFVSCAIGTGSVGYVMMTFGIADAIACVVTGYLAKVTGRLPLICAGAVLQAGLLVTILTWRPQAGITSVLHIIAVVWGSCNAIWAVLLNAVFGVLFPGREEASFAISHLWKAVGYIIAYVVSPHLRTSSKTYLMLAMMVTGVAGYFAVEVRERRRSRSLDITKEVTLNQFSGRENPGFHTE